MGDLVHIHLRTATSLKAEISKMIVKIFVIIGIVIAASAVNQGDDDSLVKERKELSEERKEITELFRRETEKLRQEDGQLRAKLEELHKRDEKHQDQNQKLQKRIAKLEKENQKLRRADSKINKVIRQRDQNETQEFDAKIKNSLRQDDVNGPIKKMMRNEINNFLTNERICVGNRISAHGADNGKSNTLTVPFGRTFPRKPTVVAALSHVSTSTAAKQVFAYTYVQKNTNSTADIYVSTFSETYCSVTWVACL